MRHTLLISYLLLALSSLSLVSQSALDEQRLLHRASYSGEYGSFDVDMVRSLYHVKGEHYRIVAKAKNFFGKIEEREDFLWKTDGSIYPLAYRYKQKVFGSKRKRSIDYNWKDNVATAKEKKKSAQIPLTPGTLGPMTYQLKLQLDLIQGATEFDYHFIQRRKLKRYTFSKLEVNTIKHGKVHIPHALQMARTNENKNRATHIWFDADLHYTLSALQQIKGRKETTMLIESSRFYLPLTGTPLAELIPLESEKGA